MAMWVLLALAVMLCAAIRHSGVRRFVEIERLHPQRAQFWVNLSTADAPELQELPGIGPALSQRIIASRESDEPLQHPDDLLRVKGIGPKRLEQIRPYLAP
jgi:competence ComEA-like helix-hairpin-helix protein